MDQTTHVHESYAHAYMLYLDWNRFVETQEESEQIMAYRERTQRKRMICASKDATGYPQTRIVALVTNRRRICSHWLHLPCQITLFARVNGQLPISVLGLLIIPMKCRTNVPW